MDKKLVTADKIRKVYGVGERTVTALQPASFEIPARCRIALVGPSGSGKTTLLHLIAGLDSPTSGTISWPALGKKEQLRPKLVTMAFQGPSLLSPLTVLENVSLPLLIAGRPEAQAFEVAWHMLEIMLLLDVAASLPEEISGGQSQRAGLARALVTHPNLVLADEPTGQQDREGACRMMDILLERVEETGAGLVVATHDIAIATMLRERWSMENGQLR